MSPRALNFRVSIAKWTSVPWALSPVSQSGTRIQALSDFAYGYNSANQRTNIVLGPDNFHWDFGYDSLGQVTSGKKHWPDGTPVAGQQFEYQFDSIGNRRQTQAGGDNSGKRGQPIV